MKEKQIKLIDLNDVMDRANAYYAVAKASQFNVDIHYMAPEQLPKIESNQVKALAKALCETINGILKEMNK